MSSSFLHWLLEATVVTSLAILFIAALRKPFRHAAGARAAYWLWLWVPAGALAVLLPGPSHPLGTAAWVSADSTMSAWIVASASTVAFSVDYAQAALLAWSVGGLLMLVLMVIRQRSFVRSLGDLTPHPDGTYRSTRVAGPMLLGVRRPRVVLPADFESRYSIEEKDLVLAHERAHRERGDALVNAAAAGSLCLFWFNPLMYWAVGRLRFDQELACDALVLSRTRAGRRRYANALLKAQLSADSALLAPVRSHWQSTHPLKERIVMLKRPLPGFARRLAGVTMTLLLTASGSYAVWAAQPMTVLEDRASDAVSRYQISSDRISVDGNGRVMLAGNVTFKPLSQASTIKIDANKTRVTDSGEKIFEGDVAMRIGEQSLKTDRATVSPDGTLRMEVVASQRLASASDAVSGSTKKSAADRPSIVSWPDLERWYPYEAKRDGIEGTVRIAVTLDEAGRATDTRVLSEIPAGHGLAAAASGMAHSIQYRNPTGRRTTFAFNVKFALRGSSPGAEKHE